MTGINYPIGETDAAVYTVKKKLSITNAFNKYYPAGSGFIFSVEGWDHTVLETCDSFNLETVWVDTDAAEYKIDRMTSLLYQSGVRAIDCIISVEEFDTDDTVKVVKLNDESLGDNDLSTTNYPTSGTPTHYMVEVPYSKFTFRGDGCSESNFYSLSAENSAGRQLNPDYLELDETTFTSGIGVKFDLNSEEITTSHAVFVTVRNAARPDLVINWFCFMVTTCSTPTIDCDSTSNYCRSYCQIERRNQFALNEMSVVQGESTTCATAVAYTDEFGFISNNDLICPVIHFYTTDIIANLDAAALEASAITLNNYDSADGSFSISI